MTGENSGKGCKDRVTAPAVRKRRTGALELITCCAVSTTQRPGAGDRHGQHVGRRPSKKRVRDQRHGHEQRGGTAPARADANAGGLAGGVTRTAGDPARSDRSPSLAPALLARSMTDISVRSSWTSSVRQSRICFRSAFFLDCRSRISIDWRRRWLPGCGDPPGLDPPCGRLPAFFILDGCGVGEASAMAARASRLRS